MCPLRYDKDRIIVQITFWVCFSLCMMTYQLNGQIILLPCTNGNQATCRCSTAPLLCTIDELDGVTLQMSNFQHPNDAPNPLCNGVTGVPNNPSWLSFTAWCEQLSLSFTLTNCVQRRYNFQWSNGVQVAIYRSCGPPNNAYQSLGCLVDAEQVCCSGNNCIPPNNMVLNLNNLIIGEIYYMMIDGCGGANCDVTVDVIGECGSERILDWVQPIQGHTVICPETINQTYSISPPQPNLNYFWYLDGNLIEDSDSNSIQLDFIDAGMYRLCVDVSNHCVPESDDPDPTCIDINVVDFLIEHPPEMAVCEGDSLLYLNRYYKEGIHVLELQSNQGCDSSVILTIKSEPIPETHIGEIRLCQGEIFDFQGEIYSEAGSYIHVLQKTEEPFCDSIIKFDILEIFISPIEDFMLNCTNNSVSVLPEINVNRSLLIHEWINFEGIILSTDSVFNIVEPGMYQLRITDIQSGCNIESNYFQIIDDRQLPMLAFELHQGLELNCTIDTLSITTDPEPNIIYLWIIDGQHYTDPSIFVVEAGEIVFKAIDTISGCMDSLSIFIVDYRVLPVFRIHSDGEINCLKEESILEIKFLDTSTLMTSVWINEKGDILGEDISSIVIMEAGMIYITAINPLNGCIYEDSIQILDNRIYPEFEVEVSGELNCINNSVILSGSYSGIAEIDWFWTLPDGTFHPNIQLQTDKPGSYLLTIINIENGCVQTKQIQVVQNFTTPDLSGFNLVPIWCKGDKGSFEFFENHTDSLPFFYFLNGEEIPNGKINNLAAGNYIFEIIDQNGCVSDTMFILQDGIELTIHIDNWVEIELGDTVILDAQINITAEELESIQWVPGDYISCPTCLTTLAFPLFDMMYGIELKDKNGCIAFENVFIKVNKDLRIFVPNAFSPNSDGINDQFTIFADNLVENVISMEIFDRWGNQVYLARGFPPNNPSFGWDGTYRGQEMQPGTFIYTIEVELIDKSRHRINGSFHLIKG